MLKLVRHTILTVAFALASASASAAIISIDADSRGWIDQTGDANGASASNNYIAGNCGLGDCGTGEFRNFFDFILPAIPDNIVSARLLLNTFNVDALQNPSVTYGVYSTSSTASFADLGTGTQYGSRTYTDADDNQVLGIALNGAAIADIIANLGSNLTISGRVTSPTAFGAAEVNQFVFGSSGDLFTTQLEITTRKGQAVPAPASLLLFLAAMAGLGWSRRK